MGFPEFILCHHVALLLFACSDLRFWGLSGKLHGLKPGRLPLCRAAKTAGIEKQVIVSEESSSEKSSNSKTYSLLLFFQTDEAPWINKRSSTVGLLQTLAKRNFPWPSVTAHIQTHRRSESSALFTFRSPRFCVRLCDALNMFFFTRDTKNLWQAA